MEPSLTQAVLAKTEEELLGGLAALMRNKVETEKAARRLTQILVETDQAQKELERIRQQVRQAEDELAFRLDEQQRAKDQVAENQTSLRAQGEHAAGQWDLWSALRAETERLRREVSQLHAQAADRSHAPSVSARMIGTEEYLTQAELDALVRHKQELDAELVTLRACRDQLDRELTPLRQEIAQRLAAREALIQEIQILTEYQDRFQAAAAEDQNALAQLTVERSRQQNEVQAIGVKLAKWQAERKSESSKLEALKAECARVQAELDQLRRSSNTLQSEQTASKPGSGMAAPDLWLEAAKTSALETGQVDEAQPLPEGYDPYRLESEFFTDEPLDAQKVSDLVAQLPGLDGCLLVKNRGPVLACRMAERYLEQLRVPERDYKVLFGRLPNRRDDLQMPEGRVATYQLENGSLSVTQAGHIFMITTSKQPCLKPGMPQKLATIAREVAKMYPGLAGGF